MVVASGSTSKQESGSKSGFYRQLFAAFTSIRIVVLTASERFGHASTIAVRSAGSTVAFSVAVGGREESFVVGS